MVQLAKLEQKRNAVNMKQNTPTPYTLLCALIRNAIWKQGTDDRLFAGCQWPALLHAAKRQAVYGLVLDGLTRLPKEMQPPRMLKLQYVALTQKLEEMNRRLERLIKDLADQFGQTCPSMVLMKGQSMATRYPIPHHRACGDVDLYCHNKDEMKAIDQWATPKASQRDNFYEAHHLVYKMDGLTLENHASLAELRSDRLNRRLKEIVEREFQANAGQLPVCHMEHTSMRELPTNLYALFLLVHMGEHLVEDGLGLRQVVDWAMFFHHDGERVDREQFCRDLEAMDLWTLAHAFGQIVVDDLGFPEERLPFRLKRNEKRHLMLVRAMMEGGNFGHDLYPWKGRVSKMKDMWLTMQVKVPRYARMHTFWPAEARACYKAMLVRGLRRMRLLP